MNYRILFSFAFILMTLTACLTSQPTAQGVPYQLAKNYFVANTLGDGPLSNPIIDNQNQFSSMFGMATTMGENGKPTAIDFDKQFVIALVGKVTDQPETFTVQKLEKKKSGLELYYKVSTTAKQSYTSQSAALLIIDRAYLQPIKLIKE